MELTRKLVEERRLGFADVVLVAEVDAETLNERRRNDPTRSRRSFELHVRLIEPLLLWYRTLGQLSAGRVELELPASGLNSADLAIGPRPDRYDLSLFDRLVSSLD